MNVKDTVILEKITVANVWFLKEMLYEALFVPPGIPLHPTSIIEQAELSKYYLHWGRAGDIGVLAKVRKMPVAACWSRVYPSDNPGYGFVDGNTPELTIAIRKEWRNQGLGKRMLSMLCTKNLTEGFKTLSLSVDKRNRALQLYNRLGFQIRTETETAFTMLKSL